MCTRCGLGYLSPRLTAGEYGAFYESVYRPLVSAYHGRRIDAETVQVEQRDYGAELVEFLRETLPAAPASVLDVGGSTGIVAGGRAGCVRRGCDGARPRARRARRRGGRRDGDDRRLRRGARPGRADLGARPPLPDDRPPPRRARDARSAAADDRGRRPRLRRRARPDDRGPQAGLGRGRRQDRSSLLPDAGDRARFLPPGRIRAGRRAALRGRALGLRARPAGPRDPDWDELRAGAERSIAELRSLG